MSIGRDTVRGTTSGNDRLLCLARVLHFPLPMTRGVYSAKMVVVVAALLLAAGCTRPADRAVKAIDLVTGDTQAFATPGDVPPGWAVCADQDCATVPETVRCQSLGTEVCSLHPGCRLEEQWCSSSSCAGSDPGDPGSAPGDAGDEAPPPCDVEPPTCEYACVPIGGDAQPPLTPLACAEVGPPPAGYCPSGQVVVRYDDQGCVTGFDCFGGCPEATATTITDCPEGTSMPVYDSKGCVVDHVCQEATGCNQLASSYAKALAAAAACDPAVAVSGAGQCSIEVPDALGCGCPTRVNPANQAALNQLKDLQSQWQQLGCDQAIACPQSAPCFAPTSTSCKGDPAGSGTCVSS